MKKRFDEEKIAGELNFLRSHNGVERMSRNTILKKLGISGGYFPFLVKAGVLIKHRRQRQFDYTIANQHYTADMVREYLSPAREYYSRERICNKKSSFVETTLSDVSKDIEIIIKFKGDSNLLKKILKGLV